LEELIWITRIPGVQVAEVTSTYERGIYCFFNTTIWDVEMREFHLEFSKLEGRPTVPPMDYSHTKFF